MEYKRLFFDIETSYMVARVWSTGKQYIRPAQLLNHTAIICICYKWEGESETHSLTWNKKQCDKTMLKKFVKVANSADEIIGHNGDNFDIKVFRARCMYHRIDCFNEYKRPTRLN